MFQAHAGSPARGSVRAAAIAIALVLSSSSSLLAQAAKAAEAEAEIRKLEEQLRQAAVKADTAVLDRILADDYTNTNGAGLTRSKAQILADAKSGASKNESITLEDVKVRVYGNAAVLTATRVSKGSLRGKDTSGRFRVLRMYTKGPGGWQAVALQLTKIAE